MSDKQGSGAARAASAVYNIAKGAAAGGMYGAAAGAAKSFLPELIKSAVIVSCAIILLPLLIFAALPNILFGFDSANADDIIGMTGKAYSIDAAYREVDNYNQAEIDRIIADIIEEHTTEDGDPEYDEIEINANTDNTNIYWFIAITSVAHQQDLYLMDEDSIKDVAISRFVHSSSIATVESEDGNDNTETIKMLKIDIEDLDPEELMDKLGFSDDERNWAHILYSTLAEEQAVGIEDSDGTGYYNTDYGNIVFTDSLTPVVYYNQTDSRWGGLRYGKTGTIARSACGPTSLAMAVATFKDSGITPIEVAEWSATNGYYVEGSGSKRTLITDGGAHYGLNVEPIGKDAKKLVEALKDGKLVIAIMVKGHFTSSGHFLVLRGVTSSGKILVADSGSYKRSNQELPLSLIVNESGKTGSAGGPFWVVSP